MSGISENNRAILAVRQRTSAPVLSCKKALEESGWDIDGACRYIAKKSFDEKNDKQCHDSYGTVALYSHEFGRVGVMVELSCESGYVAKSHEFIKLANTIAIHIAWANPRYISRKDVDPREVRAARDEFAEAMSPYEDAITAALERFYPRLCLLDQLEMKETQGRKTIGGMVNDISGKTGEKITVVRFARFKVGE